MAFSRARAEVIATTVLQESFSIHLGGDTKLCSAKPEFQPWEVPTVAYNLLTITTLCNE